MKNNTIAVAFIKYENEEHQGKTRPVLIYKQDDAHYQLFKITSKFSTKSKRIQRFYYEIREWKHSGLDQPSWIDTGRLVEFHKDWKLVRIGKLQLSDIKGLDKFLETHRGNYL